LINKEPRKDVSPDECVALGAAIQASILAPLDDELESTAAESVQTDGPVIVHLTPFSLGVGLAEDRYGVLIERNSTYPTEARDLFTTTRDFQTAISFPVYEGEESVASANTFLDMLRIDGIPPAPRGVPRIEVTFRLNQDRILEATATDLTTNKEVSVTILSTDNRLAPEEVKRLTDEARKRVAEIMKLRQRDNLVNEAESLIYRAERMFGEFDDALSESARRVVDELKTAKESNDHDRMGEIMGELNELLTRMETADY
nr:Hsp70 family protein [bacterium]